MSENSTATPPEIVERSQFPADALAAFIAQELEAWGFVVDGPDFDNVHVKVGDTVYLIAVEPGEPAPKGGEHG